MAQREYSRVAAANLHLHTAKLPVLANVVAVVVVVDATALVWLLKYLRACRWLHLIAVRGGGKGRGVARKKRSRAKMKIYREEHIVNRQPRNQAVPSIAANLMAFSCVLSLPLFLSVWVCPQQVYVCVCVCVASLDFRPGRKFACFYIIAKHLKRAKTSALKKLKAPAKGCALLRPTA